jgi:hypothetical protein
MRGLAESSGINVMVGEEVLPTYIYYGDTFLASTLYTPVSYLIDTRHCNECNPMPVTPFVVVVTNYAEDDRCFELSVDGQLVSNTCQIVHPGKSYTYRGFETKLGITEMLFAMPSPQRQGCTGTLEEKEIGTITLRVFEVDYEKSLNTASYDAVADVGIEIKPAAKTLNMASNAITFVKEGRCIEKRVKNKKQKRKNQSEAQGIPQTVEVATVGQAIGRMVLRYRLSHVLRSYGVPDVPVEDCKSVDFIRLMTASREMVQANECKRNKRKKNTIAEKIREAAQMDEPKKKTSEPIIIDLT